MRYLFIVNPFSGNFKKNYFEFVVKKFLSTNQYKIIYTTKPYQISSIIKDNLNFHIVIAGGDGSILEALPALIKYNKSFSAIPVGTSNVLSKELNISTNLKNILFNLLYQPQEYKIDIVKTNFDKYFLLMCGIGYDGLTVKTVTAKFKKYFKKFAYILSGIYSAFVYKNKRMKLKISNNEYIYYNLLIGNCKKYAGNFNLFFKSKNNDKLLDVIGFNKWNFFIALKVSLYLIVNKVSLLNKYYDYFQTDKCEIEYLDKNIYIQLDGDFCPEKLTRFEILEKQLTIIK